MLIFIGLLSLVGVIFCAVKLLKLSKQRRPKKNFAIALGVCVLIFCGCLAGTSQEDVPVNSTVSSTESSFELSISSTALEQNSSPNSSSEEVVSAASSESSQTKTLKVSSDSGSSESHKEAKSSKESVVSKAAEPSEQPQSQMVWITAKGKKYHRSSSCSNMKSPYQVTVEEAEASGRSKCSKCY